MSTFYTNRYPLDGCYKIDSEGLQEACKQTVPAGTVFVVDNISGHMFNMKTPTKSPTMTYVDAPMLQAGFIATESIETGVQS